MDKINYFQLLKENKKVRLFYYLLSDKNNMKFLLMNYYDLELDLNSLSVFNNIPKPRKFQLIKNNDSSSKKEEACGVTYNTFWMQIEDKYGSITLKTINKDGRDTLIIDEVEEWFPVYQTTLLLRKKSGELRLIEEFGRSQYIDAVFFQSLQNK